MANTLKVKVKKDGRIVEVYKLSDGKYNIFLGDNISVDKVNQKQHTETFEEEEIEVIHS